MCQRPINARQRWRWHDERHLEQSFAGQRVFQIGFATGCEGGVLSLLSVSRIALPSSRPNPSPCRTYGAAATTVVPGGFHPLVPAGRPETNRIERRSISVHAERIVNRVAYGCFWGFWRPAPLARTEPTSRCLGCRERLVGLGGGSVAHFSHRAGVLRGAGAEASMGPRSCGGAESAFELGARVRCRWLWYRCRR
jgi:hypothetical protein